MARYYRSRSRKVVDHRPEHLQTLAKRRDTLMSFINDGTPDAGIYAEHAAASAAYDKAYAQWQHDLGAAAMSQEACGDF